MSESLGYRFPSSKSKQLPGAASRVETGVKIDVQGIQIGKGR